MVNMSKSYILIIEDQLSMAMLLESQLKKLTQQPILILESMSQVEEVIESGLTISIALSDLTLPDAPNGEVIDFLRKNKVTTVVLTGSYNTKIRKKMLALRVADYVVKDGLASIQYALSTVIRLLDNPKRSIAILSTGSPLSNKLMSLLRIQNYKVFIFETPQLLLKSIEQQVPNLILLESYQMLMQGEDISFLQQIRLQFDQNILPIICCEPDAHLDYAIELLKYGVNDFIRANFTEEELFVRINQLITFSEDYQNIQNLAYKDPMTSAYNRRYFFQESVVKLADYQTKQNPYFMVMADIDFFKQVNDQFGHQVGDEAIKYVAKLLMIHFSNSLVARFGGEEFCILGQAPLNEALDFCEAVRVEIEANSEQETTVPFTLSLGVSHQFDTIDLGVKRADQALYQAKETGRNQVVLFK